ncbi:hypothetical protein PTKIN_Ptkin09bG0275600 [Pterospermum kingtungense]
MKVEGSNGLRCHNILPIQLSNETTKVRLAGRCGNINVDDELDEAVAEESLSLAYLTDKDQNNVEGIIRCLMENKKQEDEIQELDLSPYKQLWKTIVREDWKEVKKELNRNPLALTSPISEFYETVLHILVNSEKALWLVREIVDKVDSDSLGKSDYQHDTALTIAAYVGNAKAAKMMARKNTEFLTRINFSGDSPLHAAARFGHEETFRCLLTVARTTEMDDQSFFSGDNGAMIVQYLISANLYGLALDLLKFCPRLGRENLRQRKRILKKLAERPLGFESGCKLGIWERLIYKGISVTKEVTVPSIETKKSDSFRIDIVDRDKENLTHGHFLAKCRQQAYYIIGFFVPSIQRIHKTKLMNEQARQLVKSMCSGVLWTFPKASYALKLPVLKAASLGIQEIVEEIFKEYTAATMFYDENNYNIFQLAVLQRREKVFNLIYKTGLSQKWVASYPCKDKENILHLAGRCVPSRHINGAALQMQSEMQWFKAVEKFVHPLLLEQRNEKNKNPREVFDDEHKELVKEGEKWMRYTASSCMVVDALIIAMVFAAIIAAPGNNEKGIPNFRHETLFKVFVIADAAALFSSSFSLLLFLGILTSRYAEEDFLKALPKRLLLGLVTLIFSIATMLVASSSALIMLIDAVPGPKVMLRKSTIIPVTVLSALPVIFFIWSQSHLLIDVLLSTYRPTMLCYQK